MRPAVLIVLALPLAVLYAAALLTQVHTGEAALRQTGTFLAALVDMAADALLLSALALAVSAITRVRAFAIVGVIAVYLVTNAVTAIVQGVTTASALTLASAAGMLTPFELLDGFEVWALREKPLTTLVPGTLGWAYGLAAVAVLLAAVAALQLRYRRGGPGSPPPRTTPPPGAGTGGAPTAGRRRIGPGGPAPPAPTATARAPPLPR